MSAHFAQSRASGAVFAAAPITDLVAESQRLADQGVRELVIVSQDTMAYGKDLGLANGITALLRELVKVDGLKWVRFLYCYPNMVSDELVRLVAQEERLCKYFDIPYQHASRADARTNEARRAS